jgi:hypothetical protein
MSVQLSGDRCAPNCIPARLFPRLLETAWLTVFAGTLFQYEGHLALETPE